MIQIAPRAETRLPTHARALRRRRPLLREVYGALIRRLRARQGRTLNDVATRAGVSVAYLSEIERGLKEPSSEVLEAVCTALGSSIAHLVGAAHRELMLESGGAGLDVIGLDAGGLDTEDLDGSDDGVGAVVLDLTRRPAGRSSSIAEPVVEAPAHRGDVSLVAA